jgi:hypothetical protein
MDNRAFVVVLLKQDNLMDSAAFMCLSVGGQLCLLFFEAIRCKMTGTLLILKLYKAKEP